MDLSSLEAVLERAANEGRNVVPDATDDEARLIEGFAASLLGALRDDIERERQEVRELARVWNPALK